MNDAAKNKLDLFADNVRRMKKDWKWQSDLIKRFVALLYAQEGKAVDRDALKTCHTMIKQNTGAFSAFRSNLALALAALLALSTRPQTLFSDVLKVYDLLKRERFRASDYLAVAAFQIAIQTKPLAYEPVVLRTRAFYQGMKDQHYFLTGQEDHVFAAMLGLSDLALEDGLAGIEGLYQRLKREFKNKNSVQALAQVLVLGGSDERTLDRLLVLRDQFRAQKIKLDRPYTLPLLGIFAMLPQAIETLVSDFHDAQQQLRRYKGFGPWAITAQEQHLLLSSLLINRYAGEQTGELLTATLTTSISSLLLAQQAAMMAGVSASVAAASSST